MRIINQLSESQAEQLHEMFVNEWWTKDRTLPDIHKMLQHSDIVIGAVEEDSDRLIGFARVLTDRVFKALILDVIVANEARNQGGGLIIMVEILKHPHLQQVRHFELYCLSQMRPFYEMWGFTTEAGGVTFMRMENHP